MCFVFNERIYSIHCAVPVFFFSLLFHPYVAGISLSCLHLYLATCLLRSMNLPICDLYKTFMKNNNSVIVSFDIINS